MNHNLLHEKIALILSFLILNNLLFLSLSFPPLLIKINFLIFLITILVFYFKNIFENSILKISFLFIIFISLGTTIGDANYEAAAWDPRTIWLFHAKRIFYDQSIFSIADNYAAFSHNEYPKLIPAFAATLASLVGHWIEVFPKLSFPLIFLPSLILTYSFITGTRYLIYLSIVFFTIGNYLFNGWADGVVAVYFGTCALLMYLIMITNNNYYRNRTFFYLLAFCFLVSLTLIKNEGIAMLVVLFFATSLIKFYKGELRKNIKTLLFLSLSFLPIILWKLFCYSEGINSFNWHSGNIQIFHNNMLSNLLPRVGDVSNYKLIGYFLLLNEKFLITLTLFILSSWITKNKDLFSFVAIISVVYIFVLFIIYLSTPLDFYFQLVSSAARIMKSPSFLLAFFAVYNFKNYKIN